MNKEFLKSSIITFVSAFLLTIVPLIENGTFVGWDNATLFALLTTGIRAAVKALVIFWQANIK